jgi:hypothetical protein
MDWKLSEISYVELKNGMKICGNFTLTSGRTKLAVPVSFEIQFVAAEPIKKKIENAVKGLMDKFIGD